MHVLSMFATNIHNNKGQMPYVTQAADKYSLTKAPFHVASLIGCNQHHNTTMVYALGAHT
jgi:hypothetical protein